MNLYTELARAAAIWVSSCALTEDGMRWWPNRQGDASATIGIYSGMAGVLLLMTEAMRSTGEERFAIDARDLVTTIESFVDRWPVAGLYTGLPGIAFAMREYAHRTGKDKDLERVKRVLDLTCELAEPRGSGVEWPRQVQGQERVATDIVGGSAGAALALAQLGRALGHQQAIDTARMAARRLAELGEPSGEGLRWGSRAGPIEQYTPKFSHGTSGVAYALATLGQWFGEDGLVDAAIRGADHLLEIADRSDNGFKVFRHSPGGETTFPLGWCHGPTGTMRLYRRLELATGERRWADVVERAARTVRTSGIPERVYPGFWDNVASCCGSTRVAETFFELHQVTGDEDYLTFARTMTDDIVARAVRDESGARWSNFEYRKDPPDLPPETGFMQGTSGIATWLFRFGRATDGIGHDPLRWPDSPWSEGA